MLKLKFEKGTYGVFDLSQQRITVGRDTQNSIVLEQDGISGFHAEIHVERDRLFVVDLGSTNGTFVNGRRIAGREEIKTWDRLRFDSVEAEVVDSDQRRPTQISRAFTDKDLAVAGDKTLVRSAVGGLILKGTKGAMAGKVIPLAGRQVAGRESSCDIVIDETMVSSQHASLEVSGEGTSQKVKLTDLGSTNGTFVNGERITEVYLKPGDEVRFDQVAFQVESLGGGGKKTEVRPAMGAGGAIIAASTGFGTGPGGTRLAPAMGGATLQGMAGSVLGRTFSLEGGRLIIGRTEGNDIAINDDTVSSSHAVLSFGGGDWTLEDTGSSNGTFVNDTKISRVVLKSGDRIRFGQVECRFDAPVASKSAAATRMMTSVDSGTVGGKATRTSVRPSLIKRMPSWAYGLVGFVVVGIVMAGLYGLGFIGEAGSEIIDAKLQGTRIWAVETGRKGPSTPLLADINNDRYLDVIVANLDGVVIALDGAEGKKIFEADVSGRILAPLVAGDLTGDGIDDIVVAGSDGIVTALNGKGQVLWRSAGDLNLGGIVNRPVLAWINDDAIVDVIVPTPGQGLVALDGSRGWPIWNTAEMTRGKTITSPLVVDLNGNGFMDFVSVTDSGQVLAVTSRQGKVWQLWDAQVNDVLYSSPLFIRTAGPALVVVATKNSGVMALNGENGRVVWTTDIKKSFFASPVGTDATGNGFSDVVVVSTNGDIHVLEGQTGDEIWSASLGVGVQASPALWDVTNDGLADLILLDDAGNLRVIDMTRGREVLGLSISERAGFTASPLLGDVNRDQLLNVITADRNGRVTVIGINRRVPLGSSSWPVFLGNDTHGI